MSHDDILRHPRRPPGRDRVTHAHTHLCFVECLCLPVVSWDIGYGIKRTSVPQCSVWWYNVLYLLLRQCILGSCFVKAVCTLCRRFRFRRTSIATHRNVERVYTFTFTFRAFSTLLSIKATYNKYICHKK